MSAGRIAEATCTYGVQYLVDSCVVSKAGEIAVTRSVFVFFVVVSG